MRIGRGQVAGAETNEVGCRQRLDGRAAAIGDVEIKHDDSVASRDRETG